MPNLEELLNQRNAIRDQMSQAATPVTQNDAARYLNERVNNFQPLMEERRSLQAQAANVLPQQIQQYTAQRQANPNQGPSAMSALSSILNNQNRLRATSDLVGDQIEGARGRLGNIANDALSMLQQQQQNYARQFDIANQDYGRAYESDQQRIQREYQAAEAEKQRRFQANEAAKARAASRAAAASSGMGRNSALDALFAGVKDINRDGKITGEDLRANQQAGNQSQANSNWLNNLDFNKLTGIARDLNSVATTPMPGGIFGKGALALTKPNLWNEAKKIGNTATGGQGFIPDNIQNSIKKPFFGLFGN
jgi:DNA repair exonuclease SbcCD ATPase subunit